MEKKKYTHEMCTCGTVVLLSEYDAKTKKCETIPIFLVGFDASFLLVDIIKEI